MCLFGPECTSGALWGCAGVEHSQRTSAQAHPNIQARKKSTKINFLGPETPQWGGVFHSKGWCRKVRALPRKFVFLGFQREESGMSREFCRDVPDPWGCSKSLCKKKFVRIFRSLIKEPRLPFSNFFGDNELICSQTL